MSVTHSPPPPPFADRSTRRSWGTSFCASQLTSRLSLAGGTETSSRSCSTSRSDAAGCSITVAARRCDLLCDEQRHPADSVLSCPPVLLLCGARHRSSNAAYRLHGEAVGVYSDDGSSRAVAAEGDAGSQVVGRTLRELARVAAWQATTSSGGDPPGQEQHDAVFTSSCRRAARPGP